MRAKTRKPKSKSHSKPAQKRKAPLPVSRLSSDDDDDDDDEDSEDDGFSDAASSSGAPAVDESASDVKEGRTLFVRNISFDSTEADVQRVFETFGVVDFCKLVIDRCTDTSAGRAFVKFETQTASELALRSAHELSLAGRPLNVCLAVTRREAHSLLADKKAGAGADADGKQAAKKKLGARNLHLAREGLVRAGTRDAEGLSAADLAKRAALEATKRAKLRNPDIFVSPVRLCVRNLSSRVDDKTLRGIVRGAAGERAAWVTECRIMRDLGRLSAEGVGKSRGYAFVTFKEHRHALTALRALNNSAPATLPGHGGGGANARRLIVEFSLENRLALDAKKHRAERAQLKAAILRGDDVGVKRGAGGEGDYLQKVVASDADESQQSKSRKRGVGLSSHTGPKVRHKTRPGQMVAPKRPAGRPSRAEFRRQRALDRGYVPGAEDAPSAVVPASGHKRQKR